MPYILNIDDENKPNAPVSPGGSGGVPTGASSGVGSPGAGTPSAGAPQAGGGFATLDKYVNANQGQAQGIANSVTSGINDQYNTLQGQNQSTLQGIQGNVDQGYTKQNQAILDQEAAAPVRFAGNDANVSAFQGQLNDKYTGPASAEGTAGYQNQYANLNNAIATGQSQVNTEAGREGLLQGTEARPTAGVTALNSAILSNDNNASSQVANAYNPFSTLVSGLSSGAQGIDTNIGNATTEASNASTAANKAISDQQNALNTAVTGEVGQAQTAAQKQEQDTAQQLANLYGGQAVDNTASTLGTYGGGTTPWYNLTNYTAGPFSSGLQSRLGITNDQATALQQQMQRAGTAQDYAQGNFGAFSPTTQVDNSQFLTQADPTQAITAANEATADQYAQQAAYQKLLGSLPSGAILDPTQAAMAGTAPTNLNSFDYQGALGNATSTADAEKQAAIDEAATINAQGDLAHAESEHGGGFGGLLKTIAEGAVNPLLTVPAQVAAGKKLASKV